MKKRILSLIFACVFCLVLVCPLNADAIMPLDPDAEASLTLHYQKEGIGFPDLSIGMYRIAQAFPDGSFQLLEPFDAYPIDIHGITTQEQWNHVAQTLWSYLVADQVKPDRETVTDGAGKAVFAGLDTGLYFVREVVAENEKGTYVFNQFLVYVPTPQGDGSYTYDVETMPKCTMFVPKEQYSVTKLWQDSGNQNARPKTVTVEIYCDGVLQETQVLSSDNNWTYRWSVSGEEQGNWTVVERDVPDPYKVTIQSDGSHFSIINTWQSPSDVPQTGDSFALLYWIMLMCFSGTILLVLGIHSWRRR